MKSSLKLLKQKAERKRLQIEKAPFVSHEAKLVKMADKLSNLSGLKSDPPKEWTSKLKKLSPKFYLS